MTKLPSWLAFAELEDRVTPDETLQALGERMGVPLRITAYNRGRWTCAFRGVEVLDGGILASEYGSGASPEEAAREYAKAISHAKLVVNASGGAFRREYVTGNVIAEGA